MVGSDVCVVIVFVVVSDDVVVGINDGRCSSGYDIMENMNDKISTSFIYVEKAIEEVI